MQNHKLLLQDLSSCIKILSADAVERAASGHPGLPIGFADIMTVLAFEFLNFDAKNPRYPNRDRLVLSAGHGSLLLYSFYYLAGYKDFTLEDLKNFRQLHSKTAGHPEYEIYDAIETTTGPLGQGFGNAVGMAIAAKKRSESHKIYCIVGDGCLMEGLGYESASLAGHLGLNNLIILFDDNKITIDGSTSLAVSEDHMTKFQAMGWIVEKVDGHNFDKIRAALLKAQNATKPIFIAFKTTIANGAPTKAGSEAAHGAPLGIEEIIGLKKKLGWNEEDFYIPDHLLDLWRSAGCKSNIDRDEAIIRNPVSSAIIDESLIDYNEDKPPSLEATRVSSGKILSHLIKNNPKIIAGSADLSHSNNIKSSESNVITRENHSGNFLHYGVREAVMGAVMNGLALEGYIPVGGTFLVFSDYMRPSIRLAAIMNLRVIYIMTHDSIGVGEDGPTHQPIEHLASLRAMPNLVVMRPADFNETLQCWNIALKRQGPTLFALSRQSLPQITENKQVSKGAYIIHDSKYPSATIFASGSELQIAMKIIDIIPNVRIVSIPSFELFFYQPQDYIEELLGGDELKVGIEAASSFGWERIIGRKGLFCGIDSFGASAPAKDLFKFYEITAESIAEKIKMRLK